MPFERKTATMQNMAQDVLAQMNDDPSDKRLIIQSAQQAQAVLFKLMQDYIQKCGFKKHHAEQMKSACSEHLDNGEKQPGVALTDFLETIAEWELKTDGHVFRALSVVNDIMPDSSKCEDTSLQTACQLLNQIVSPAYGYSKNQVHYHDPMEGSVDAEEIGFDYESSPNNQMSLTKNTSPNQQQHLLASSTSPDYSPYTRLVTAAYTSVAASSGAETSATSPSTTSTRTSLSSHPDAQFGADSEHSHESNEGPQRRSRPGQSDRSAFSAV